MAGFEQHDRARTRAQSGSPRLTIAAALVVALTVALLTGAAQAHHGEPATTGEVIEGQSDPGKLGQQHTGGIVGTDSEQTPTAKPDEEAGWEQIAGSRWRSDSTIADLARPAPGESSPTPYDLDFYGLGFLDVDVAITNGLSREAARIASETNGFAVGAQCRREDPAEPVGPDEVAGCERIPVIYRYREHPTKGLVWEESYRGSDATDPGGFIASVAWLTPDRALAVGGTRAYPRREQELTEGPDGQIDACRDEALEAEQEALAEWAGDPESETEVEFGSSVTGQFIPQRASANDVAEYDGGLSVKRGAYERALEECEGRTRAENDLAAGAGAARAWLFESGAWHEIAKGALPGEMAALQALAASPRPTDCGAEVERECAIAGGMRQLWHFADGEFADEGFGPELDDGAGIAGARDFRFRVREIRFAPNWRILGNLSVPSGNVEPRPPDSSLISPSSPYAVAVTAGCCASARSDDHPSDLALNAAGWRARHAAPSLTTSTNLSNYNTAARHAPLFNPDSYYALRMLRQAATSGNPTDITSIAVMRTPGGPSARYEGSREPPSRFSTRGPSCDDEACARDNPTLSSLRLTAADGDSVTSHSSAFGEGPDGVPDWAVGVVRSSGQGVAYRQARGEPCPAGGQDERLLDFGESGGVPTPQAFWAQQASTRLCALGSYALNAYRVAGEDPVGGDEGTGWAVGDHGAIVTRGGGIASAENPPARRGATSEPASLARESFDAHRAPVTDEPGPVPAIAPGTVAMDEPGFAEGQIPFGGGSSPDLFVMSRDGSEGWAMRSGAGISQSGFYRYDGLRWVPCYSRGIGELIPADPACAELPGHIRALARIPLERDSDPTNDDEFEAVALAGSAIYRYSRDRWARDEKLSEGFPGASDIVFTAPDDGWVVDLDLQTPNTATASHITEVSVMHYDGESWEDCTPTTGSAPAHCGDSTNQRLRIRTLCPTAGPAVGLATAGERVYLHSIRATGAMRTRPPLLDPRRQQAVQAASEGAPSVAVTTPPLYSGVVRIAGLRREAGPESRSAATYSPRRLRTKYHRR